MAAKNKKKPAFDPYSYVRVNVMRSKLIKKDEYHRLMKMDLTSILRYLEETEYKKAVDRDMPHYKGLDLVERSINDGLVNSFEKLRQITMEDLHELINLYLRRWDIYNIKTIIRGIASKSGEDYTASLLVPAGALGIDFLSGLIRQNDIQKVMKSVQWLQKDALLMKDTQDMQDSKSIYDIENNLDRAYFGSIAAFSLGMPGEGALFSEFMRMEIDMLNIKNLLRMKREGMKPEEIRKYLLPEGSKLSKNGLAKMSNAAGMEPLIEMLNKTYYAKFVKFEKTDSLIGIELQLDRLWLKKTGLYSHQNPLTILTILGFMLEKEIEVKNLKAIVKAKQLGIEQDFIENSLVVA